MKKVLLMLFSVAFATCVLAAYGDIYSITPLSEKGKVYKAGETVKFQVRLLSRNYDTPNPLAYQLVYTGSGTEAEDKTTNPPMLGIVVSGQLRGATITEVRPAAIMGDQTVNPYTDLICEYVVQLGDIASPIKLALNGSTESNPIVPVSADAVNNSGYILINGNRWDLRIKGQATSASLRFVSSSTANMAKGFWNQLGTTVVDYNLAQANFQVNAPLDPIEYLTWDAATKSLVAATNTSYTVVTKDTATFEDKKWYVVTNTIERAGIKVNGAAHLILCDGASLTVTGADNEAGIEVPTGKSLTIYGQSEGTGELEANGGEYGAGIGGNVKGTCGTMTINGGTITATGGYLGAGIGGGSRTANAATITINGGNVEAIGGTQGAGIGSGNYYEFSGSRNGTDVITINGGMITATGGKWGAGIGSGSDGFAATVTINGGTITASTVPDQGAEAIGNGADAVAGTTVAFGTAMASKYVWAGESATTGEMITTAAFASDHSATYAEVPIETYTVAYDANGAAGVMSNSVFAVSKNVNLKSNAFSALGYTFAGWTTNGVDEVAYADGAAGVDFTTAGETLELTAKWTATTDPIEADCYEVLTNLIEQASLPVTLTLTEDITLETGDKVAIPESKEISFAGTGTLDVSGIVPTFGTPVVVGEGFTSTNAPALFKTGDDAKLVFDEGTLSLVARGESEDFPWILDAAATNVTAWVENSNLVIDNGLSEEAYEIDLVALTNSVAKYGYTPASPLNAKVKVVEGGETSYKTPTLWIGESGTYATLGAALDAGEATVLPGYGVTYSANGAAGVMTNSIFAVNKQVTLKSNAFSAVGYDFDGWTAGTNTYQNAQSGTNFASVDGTLALIAQWSLNTNGVTATSFTNLTNTIATAGLQKTNLPITIDFTSDVKIDGAALPTLPTGTGFNGLKYLGDEEGGSNLELADGVLYGSAMRGEVTVDALVLMQLANGGTISSFQAITEGETTVTNAVVMLLGDDGKAYFNDADDVDQMIADILAADPRPTTVKLYEVKGAMVTFEAMGGTLTNGLETVTYLCLPDTGYVLPDEVEREGYTLKGWFDSWKPGANEITNNQEIVDYAPQSLYAQWTSTAPTPKADELHISDVTNNVPVTEIAAKAYVNKTSVKTVTTPLYLKKICNRAFMGCTALEKLTITATRDYETLEPTKVTIEQNAFSGCTSLEELLIAGDIEKIGQSAFQNCAKLKKIIFRGDEAIAYDPGAFYRCGYANGTDELKVYMSSAFQAANAQLISDFQAWNTQVKIIDKIGVEPVTGETTVSIDPAGLVAGKRVAIVVQTSVKGTPDKEDVDIELSTDLATWTPITEGVEKTAYPDGTVMIEITVPNAPSAFFRAVVKEN